MFPSRKTNSMYRIIARVEPRYGCFIKLEERENWIAANWIPTHSSTHQVKII